MERGPSGIESWSGEGIPRSLRIAADFAAIVRSERLPATLADVARAGGVVLAALDEKELRGYATLVPSSALTGEPWEGLPDTFELGSIEVARSHRGHGLGSALLARLGASIPLERVVVFARGFISHWDLAFAGQPPVFHRRMLLRMLDRAGFQRWETDDPEVNDHPMNFLAVRTGLDAPAASILRLRERALRAPRHPWW